MNPLWLLAIVPVVWCMGFFVAAILFIAKDPSEQIVTSHLMEQVRKGRAGI